MRIFGYNIYFWSNEGNPLEPVHVHVGKTQSENSTKIWILSNGELEIAHISNDMNKNELNKLMKSIKIYSDELVAAWEKYFGKKATYVDVLNLNNEYNEYER